MPSWGYSSHVSGSPCCYHRRVPHLPSREHGTCVLSCWGFLEVLDFYLLRPLLLNSQHLESRNIRKEILRGLTFSKTLNIILLFRQLEQKCTSGRGKKSSLGEAWGSEMKMELGEPGTRGEPRIYKLTKSWTLQHCPPKDSGTYCKRQLGLLQGAQRGAGH